MVNMSEWGTPSVPDRELVAGTIMEMMAIRQTWQDDTMHTNNKISKCGKMCNMNNHHQHKVLLKKHMTVMISWMIILRKMNMSDQVAGIRNMNNKMTTTYEDRCPQDLFGLMAAPRRPSIPLRKNQAADYSVGMVPPNHEYPLKDHPVRKAFIFSDDMLAMGGWKLETAENM